MIRLFLKSSVAALLAAFTLSCGTTEPEPSVALTLGSQTLQITQGENNTVTVTLARTNFTGDVALTATGLPTGITASFNPATLTGDVASSTLTLAAAINATAGAATVTVNATGTGVATQSKTLALTVLAAPPSISIATSASTLTVTQGASGSVTINVGRVNFTGDVALSASGLPTGVSAAFNPSPVTGATATSTLTLTATSTATPGTATVTITGSGTGVTSKTATVALTVNVAGSYTLAASPSSVTLNQGQTATSTINITRTGGFAQNVTLAATGLPTGVTAAFNPAAAGGTSSTLTLTATGSAATGTSTVTITGTTPGLSNQTTTISLTVQTPPSTTTVNLQFCVNPAQEQLLWVGYQNEGAAWVRLTPDASGKASYQATPKTAIMEVRDSDPGTAVGFVSKSALYATATELKAFEGQSCTTAGTKSLSGSVSGLGTGQTAVVSMLDQAQFINPPQTSYTFSNLPTGAIDLVATRRTTSATASIPDRLILRRGLDLSSGSTIPMLDFAASEAVALSTATATITGLNAGEQGFASVQFRSSAGTVHDVWFSQLSGGSATYSAIPTSSTVTGDMHAIFASGSTTTDVRFAGVFHRNPGSITIALGPVLSTPTVTVVQSSPSQRYRLQLPSQADYNGFVNFGANQQAMTGGRDLWMTVTAAFLGGAPATWDITQPDMSSAPGWQSSWDNQAGQTSEIFVGAGTASLLTAFESGFGAEGTAIKFAEKEVPTTGLQSNVLLPSIRARPESRSLAERFAPRMRR